MYTFRKYSLQSCCRKVGPPNADQNKKQGLHAGHDRYDGGGYRRSQPLRHPYRPHTHHPVHPGPLLLPLYPGLETGRPGHAGLHPAGDGRDPGIQRL